LRILDLTVPGNFAVAPLTPLRVRQQQRHGFPPISVAPRQAVIGVLL
jgi:hypothetical protein